MLSTVLSAARPSAAARAAEQLPRVPAVRGGARVLAGHRRVPRRHGGGQAPDLLEEAEERAARDEPRARRIGEVVESSRSASSRPALRAGGRALRGHRQAPRRDPGVHAGRPLGAGARDARQLGPKVERECRRRKRSMSERAPRRTWSTGQRREGIEAYAKGRGAAPRGRRAAGGAHAVKYATLHGAALIQQGVHRRGQGLRDARYRAAERGDVPPAGEGDPLSSGDYDGGEVDSKSTRGMRCGRCCRRWCRTCGSRATRR